MTRLPQSTIDTAVPELRTLAKLTELEQRLADLESLRSLGSPTQIALYSTGDTSVLGGAYQLVPGLSATIALEPGWMVVGDAKVYLQWGSGVVSAFWGRSTTPGAGVSTHSLNEAGLLGPNLTTNALVSVPALLQSFVVPSGAAGNYTFGVYAQAAGSSGYAIGSNAASYGRLLVFKR